MTLIEHDSSSQTLNNVSKQIIFDIMMWIVDGYNVIFSDTRLLKLSRNDMETARDELLREIQSGQRWLNGKATVVFDGKYRTTAEKISDNLSVSFSGTGQTADELMKKEVGNSTTRRSLGIVTNDLEIINYARICGVPRNNILKSEDFLTIIRNSVPGLKGSGRMTQSNRSSRTREDRNWASEKPATINNNDKELLRLFKENKR